MDFPPFLVDLHGVTSPLKPLWFIKLLRFIAAYFLTMLGTRDSTQCNINKGLNVKIKRMKNKAKAIKRIWYYNNK